MMKKIIYFDMDGVLDDAIYAPSEFFDL